MCLVYKKSIAWSGIQGKFSFISSDFYFHFRLDFFISLLWTYLIISPLSVAKNWDLPLRIDFFITLHSWKINRIGRFYLNTLYHDSCFLQDLTALAWNSFEFVNTISFSNVVSITWLLIFPKSRKQIEKHFKFITWFQQYWLFWLPDSIYFY